MSIKQTHTYVELEISKAAYDEIAGKLRAAGYHHVFTDGGAIDMHGLALVNFVEAVDKPDFDLRGRDLAQPLCDCDVGMCTHRKDCRQKTGSSA